MKKNKIKECTFYVQGMHCATCEILIEKKLLKENNIEAVDASLSQGMVQIEYIGERPNAIKISNKFKNLGYVFSDKKFKHKKEAALFTFNNGVVSINSEKFNHLLQTGLVIALLFVAFFIIEKSGIASKMSVDSTSALPAFFIFGLLAGLSSCAALVGGILLSMSKKWNEMHMGSDSQLQKAQPFVLFNLGRILSYTFFGGVLGLIGGLLGIKTGAGTNIITTLITIGVVFIMIILGLQMLGVEWASKIQFRLPKFLSRDVADEEKYHGKFMPFSMGAATFFLPCGFTIITQGIALTSGSFVQGALIMFLFSLGTLPMLAFISFSSIGMNSKPQLSMFFNQVAGVIVIFFALFNLNGQFTILGLPTINDAGGFVANMFKSDEQTDTDEINSEIVDGQQILKTSAGSSGYSPSFVTIKADIPTRWEIKNTGASGCTGSIVSNDLGIDGVNLENGTTIIELPPLKKDTYKYSCWMGMVRGVIKAI